jgi:hypothetical protein
MLPIHCQRRRTVHRLLLTLLMAAFGSTMLTARPAHAAFLYLVTNTDNSGAGSLRQAILDANGTAGLDTIRFNIPGDGVQIINLATSLPTITDPVRIEGLSQPGASCAAWPPTLRIELRGEAVPPNSIGFNVTAGGSTISGLAITGFDTGIRLATAGGNQIECNYIGIDASGTGEVGNDIGVQILSNENTIGGGQGGQRNVIANATFHGIELGGAATNNVIAGNYIGVNPAGNAARGNDAAGIHLGANAHGNFIGGQGAALRNVISGNRLGLYIESNQNEILGNSIGMNAANSAVLPNTEHGVLLEGADGNRIGGGGVGEGNLIAGNGGDGVRLLLASQNNDVYGNRIGTNGSGADLGNGGAGVLLSSNSSGNRIGGVGSGQGNAIAHNRDDGVTVIGAGAAGNSIRGNAIHSNTGLGIDLGNPGATGVTPNDPGDGDAGGNGLQNYPVLADFTVTDATGTLTVQLNSTPNAMFTIDIYMNTLCDASDFGEGRRRIGDPVIINTNGQGNGSVQVEFPTAEVDAWFTATASDANGATSEFSACRLGIPRVYLPFIDR